jgi:hypothetical protein
MALGSAVWTVGALVLAVAALVYDEIVRAKVAGAPQQTGWHEHDHGGLDDPEIQREVERHFIVPIHGHMRRCSAGRGATAAYGH